MQQRLGWGSSSGRRREAPARPRAEAAADEAPARPRAEAAARPPQGLVWAVFPGASTGGYEVWEDDGATDVYAAGGGVRTSLADFYEKNKDTLRSPEEGADTIVWLASTATLPPAASGQLFFDRAVASQHYLLAGTASNPAEAARLWSSCEGDAAWRYEGSAEKAALARL